MWHERLPLLWGVEARGRTVSKRGGVRRDYRIGIRRHYLKFTQTELKFLTQLIILFFHLHPLIPTPQKVSAHRPRPSHFFIFFIPYEMIHTDNLGSAV